MLTTATVPFLVPLLAGLLLGVFAMLHGIRSVDPDKELPLIWRALPGIATFGATFGITGYLLVRRSSLDYPVVLAIALGVGAVLSTTTMMFVTRWALGAPVDSAEEEAHELQGQIATVARDIGPGLNGEITYELNGQRLTVFAQTIDGVIARAGTEVVIDRIEHGVASVELWSAVEQRL